MNEYAGIHHSKYWMPIHYDTIEDGQNKNISSIILYAYCLHLTPTLKDKSIKFLILPHQSVVTLLNQT